MAYYLSADTILDRLVVCCGEISGILKVYRYVPTNPIGTFPCIQIEGLDRTATRTSEGWAVTQWTIACICLVSTTTGTDTTEGFYPLSVSEPYEDALETYFLSHPYLETTSGLSGLGLLAPLTIAVQHGQSQVSKGGAPLLVIPFQITVELDRAVN